MMKKTNNMNMTFDSRASKINKFNLRIKSDIFVFVLAVFIAVAAIQAVELNHMMSEAKAISTGLGGIRTSREILLEQYSLL